MNQKHVRRVIGERICLVRRELTNFMVTIQALTSSLPFVLIQKGPQASWPTVEKGATRSVSGATRSRGPIWGGAGVALTALQSTQCETVRLALEMSPLVWNFFWNVAARATALPACDTLVTWMWQRMVLTMGWSASKWTPSPLSGGDSKERLDIERGSARLPGAVFP